MQVAERFTTFLAALVITVDQRADGITKHTGVRFTLNSHYYGTSSGYSNGFLVGSWGKSTEVRPPRDVDVMFVLPESIYQKYQNVPGNRQSQLLQEVKRVLERAYPRTKMRGDGQVVVVPFTTYAVEVAPAFKLTTGQYWICDTNEGGKYKTSDPDAEIANVKSSNDNTMGNTRDLIRMMKRWQAECNVPLKSFVIELLAIEFLKSWQYAGSSTVYYDWMVRDFFKYLISRSSGLSFVSVPGTFETIWLGNDWKSRTETALERAEKAVKFEADGYPYSAGGEWQKIFGTDIPSG